MAAAICEIVIFFMVWRSTAATGERDAVKGDVLRGVVDQDGTMGEGEVVVIIGITGW